jgi:hypothetical protein
VKDSSKGSGEDLLLFDLTGKTGVDSYSSEPIGLSCVNRALLWAHTIGFSVTGGIFRGNTREIAFEGSPSCPFRLNNCVFSGDFLAEGGWYSLSGACRENAVTESWAIRGVGDRPECPTNSPTASASVSRPFAPSKCFKQSDGLAVSRVPTATVRAGVSEGHRESSEHAAAEVPGKVRGRVADDRDRRRVRPHDR